VQCVSCRFENTPDSLNCCRCGTHLRLRESSIDVQPPRAKKWDKRLRKCLPKPGLGRFWRRLIGSIGEPQSGDFLPATSWSLLWRSIVPGWAHFHLGQRRRGKFFLALFLVFMFLGVLQFGSTVGNVLLGLGMSVHASAVLDLLQQEQRGNMLGRLARAFLTIIVLSFLFYLPVGFLIGSVAGPRVIELTMSPLREGDVFLCNFWAYWGSPPAPGEVVLYRSEGAGVQGPGNQQLRIPRGERIERIIAGPGDRVHCRGGALFVNGTSSEWQPLNPNVLTFDWELQVPHGHVCIIPSTLLTAAQFRTAWRNVVSVPIDNVAAKVYFQLQPLTHMGFVR
jgi:hypothetical protein